VRKRSNWAGALRNSLFLHAHSLTFIPILSLFTHARRFATPKIDGHWGDWARKVDRAPDKTKLLIGEGIFFRKKKKEKTRPPTSTFFADSHSHMLLLGAGGQPPRRGLREQEDLKTLRDKRERRKEDNKLCSPIFVLTQKSKKTSAPLVDPPTRLAAAYRPLSGPYSSRDPAAVRAHLELLAAAGVGGVLTYCSAPTVAAVEPSRNAVKQGLVAAAAASSSSSSRPASSTTAAVGRQLLQRQQQQQQQAKTAGAGASAATSVRIVPAERPTNASALATLVAQAAALGLGVGFVVPEYRHRNARTVRDDLRWCAGVARAAVAASAAARGALAARSPAARRAQPLAPLLSHRGRAVFLVKAAASIPCHHWAALLKPGGAFSVREGEGSGAAAGARASSRKAAAGGPKRGKKGAEGAVAVAGAGAISGRRRRRSLFGASSSSLSSSTAAAAGKTTVRSAFSSSSGASSASTSPASPDDPPVSLDGFWIAEWRDRDDGDVAASCGFDGVATAPADDGADTSGAESASAAENGEGEAAPFGADPGNWPSMRARARRQGLAFLATVSPGSDATPVRPWGASRVRGRADSFREERNFFFSSSSSSFRFFPSHFSVFKKNVQKKRKRPQVRSREPGGARYSRLWRYAALSGPDSVVVDSFNGWNEGTQIEPAAAAAGCGGGGERSGGDEEEKGGKAASSSSSSSSATALGPQCAPDVRSYAEGEEGATSSSSSSSGSDSGEDDASGSRKKKRSRQQKQRDATSHLYMRLTASEAARAAVLATRVGLASYELPRALASQLEARGRPSE